VSPRFATTAAVAVDEDGYVPPGEVAARVERAAAGGDLESRERVSRCEQVVLA
jgi:hypothetical protein